VKDTVDLSGQLKAARLATGKSVRAVAKATGVTRMSIAQYEDGSRTPSVATLLKLLVAYELHDVAAVIMGLDAELAVKLHPAA
jgi:transcriptional regulator with XRE-family HTH domain